MIARHHGDLPHHSDLPHHFNILCLFYNIYKHNMNSPQVSSSAAASSNRNISK